ncbi:hypothetical protein GQ54DRAFT_295418, partial [Martensiomyces pterosporus]
MGVAWSSAATPTILFLFVSCLYILLHVHKRTRFYLLVSLSPTTHLVACAFPFYTLLSWRPRGAQSFV